VGLWEGERGEWVWREKANIKALQTGRRRTCELKIPCALKPTAGYV